VMKVTSLVVCLVALGIALGLVVTGLAQGEHPGTLAMPLVESPRYRIVEATHDFDGNQPIHHVFLLDSESGRVWEYDLRLLSDTGGKSLFMGWKRSYVEGIQEEGQMASQMARPAPAR